MGQRILWFDNDLDYLAAYVVALQEDGHQVTTVGSLDDADRELSSSQFALLILDVMVPTHSEAEEQRYPPEATDRGTSTGLLYYKTWRDQLARAGTSVLVLTVRLDVKVRQAFIDAGLPSSAVARKVDLRDVNEFVRKVEQVLDRRAVR